MTCRRCSECKNMSHHWLPTGFEHPDYKCKHCDALGDLCSACGGDGCEQCEQEGVVVLVTDFPSNRMRYQDVIDTLKGYSKQIVTGHKPTMFDEMVSTLENSRNSVAAALDHAASALKDYAHFGESGIPNDECEARMRCMSAKRGLYNL